MKIYVVFRKKKSYKLERNRYFTLYYLKLKKIHKKHT